MKKFCVFSGFLGSGKTTAMMALTRLDPARFGKTAMISNDLGHGVELADNRLARLSGCNASEMTESCICYQNENLAARINQHFAEGCELVISDIPGFGVGALEHVYHGLNEKFPGVYALAPFTVLVEPRTAELLRTERGGDLTYILHTQLVEADCIVLNKCDTCTKEQTSELLSWLKAHYPAAECIAVSARTGEGMETLRTILRDGTASMRRPEIGYGGENFQRAMGMISEYYLQYHATVCCDDFDGNAYLMRIAELARERLTAAGMEIPHLKLLAWEPEGAYAKLDLIGKERPVETVHSFPHPCTELAVILNASAVCPAPLLQEILMGAAEKSAEEYQLEMLIFREECFGMGD